MQIIPNFENEIGFRYIAEQPDENRTFVIFVGVTVALAIDIADIHGADAEWLRERFSDELTDAHGYVTIGDNEYASGEIIRKLDPIAFDCALDEYLNPTGPDNKPERKFNLSNVFVLNVGTWMECIGYQAIND